MKTSAARALTYSVVGVLAFAAVRLSPPLPQQPPVIAALAPAPEPVAPEWHTHIDTVGRGETLFGVLARGGVSEIVAREALRTIDVLDMRRIPAGLTLSVRTAPEDSVPSEIVLNLAIDRLVRLQRTDAGWSGNEERLEWTKDTIAVSGVIQANLYTALDSGAAGLLPSRARSELAWKMADIFEYRVDMSRDLRVGDEFRLLVERETAPNGLVRSGNVLAATFTLSGEEMQAIRFESKNVSGDYFDQEGRSLRAAFLRAPLNFRRISSVFGRRKHPVHGTWRTHKGTDYAASSGTPVRAIGDGTVIFAGWKGGYGNTLELRHRNGYVTRHGHLKGFAKGIRRGKHVTIGTTVAYVGSTGLSTGPHLHFEVLVNGVQRDPRTALKTKGGEPIPKSERAAFAAQQRQLIAALDLRSAEPMTRLAQR